MQQEGISSFLGALLTSEESNLIIVISEDESQMSGSACPLIPSQKSPFSFYTTSFIYAIDITHLDF